jgi:plastocyanin
MTSKRAYLWLSAVLLSVALAGAASCKSGSNGMPTSPAGGSELNSGDIRPGATFEHQFATAGTYAYHCIHHAPMTGSVQVSEGAANDVANVSITSSSMSFPGASVKPGGRVVWTNNTGELHTVTSN